MDSRLLFGIWGVVGPALCYFAGQSRAERRHREDGIRRALDRYLEIERSGATSGLDALLKSGAADLMTDAEIRRLGRLIATHGRTDPLALRAEVLAGVDLKGFFGWVVGTRARLVGREPAEIVAEYEAWRKEGRAEPST